MPKPREIPFPGLLAAGSALHADAVAGESIRALRDSNIGAVLLRGPVVARHLYDESEVRTYADVDLLIEEHHRNAAEGTLQRLGYEHRAVLGQRTADRPRWSSTWVRRHDGAEVDLHSSLVGTRATSAEVWSGFSGELEHVQVLGTVVNGLNAPATALVVALHAAHHGPAIRRPLEDLQRALNRFPADVWEHAAVLADRLGAAEAMGAGLELIEGGAELADQLGLPATRSAETILRAQSAPPTALGFEWLARTPGARRKALLAAGKLVPDREFMRAWFPPAGRSKAGLFLGYLWRPVWLIRHGLPGLRAWRHAQSQSRGSHDRP